MILISSALSLSLPSLLSFSSSPHFLSFLQVTTASLFRCRSFQFVSFSYFFFQFRTFGLRISRKEKPETLQHQFDKLCSSAAGLGVAGIVFNHTGGRSWKKNNELKKESSAPVSRIHDATMLPHTAFSGKRSRTRKIQARRRKFKATIHTAVLTLAISTLPATMAQKCIPLSGSIQCPAFNQSSLSTDSKLTGLLCVSSQ